MKYVRMLHHDGFSVLRIFWSQVIQFAFQKLIAYDFILPLSRWLAWLGQI